MDVKDRRKENQNRMIAFFAVLLLGTVTALLFDYYYDLNDDVLMKDILAGAYTGEPESRNIQMLWFVSAGISLCYRVARALPWYGLFLCFCHFGCLFLILKRSLVFAQTTAGKILVALTELLLFAGLFLPHLVYAQYTVTCTLLGAAAAFLFYTTEISLPAGAFIRKNIPAVLLVALAYLIRSEMLLLVLPMICAAGVFKWGSEKKIFTKEHGIKYLTVIGMILAGILLGQLSHRIAYGSEEWRTFLTFFDNRTELYDFQAPPSYEAHQDFYESIGLSASEKVLLDNYNFGMSEKIDEEMVGEIAAYAGEIKGAQEPFSERLVRALTFYRYRFTHGPLDTGSDYPWNYAVILGYLSVLVLAALGKQLKAGIWKLTLLFSVRTMLWMFILLRGRDPERITHSLYLMELCILAAMIFIKWSGLSQGKRKKCAAGLTLAAFGALAVAVLPLSIEETERQQAERQQENRPYQALYEYFASEENCDNFYLIDVYSSVSYSEKMFAEVDNSLDNYDIMGGWACKSPLQKKKLAAFGITGMAQALKDQENVYFVQKNTEDKKWLEEYYAGQGMPVQVTLLERVAEVFEIYEVRSADAVK